MNDDEKRFIVENKKNSPFKDSMMETMGKTMGGCLSSIIIFFLIIFIWAVLTVIMKN